MNQDGTEPQALTTTNMESHPDFSRDGKYIAFVSGRDRSLEIYRMQADGNDQQRLTFVEDSPEQRVGPAPRNRSPVHTPDGESIMFVCLPIGPSQHPEHGNRLVLQPGQIHRIQNNGTERQALVTLEGGCDDPQFSPDGTWLAFRNQAQRRSSNDGPSCICLSRPDGSGLMRLRGSYGMCESFHPEGNRIVFASCRDRRFEPARRNWDLYCIDVQDGELQRLSDNEAFDNCPVFSPGGSRILFCSDREGYEELYTMPYGE